MKLSHTHLPADCRAISDVSDRCESSPQRASSRAAKAGTRDQDDRPVEISVAIVATPPAPAGSDDCARRSGRRQSATNCLFKVVWSQARDP